MFKLNLKIAFRNLWKNKGYTLINILGLSIGMASCILVFIFIRYELSFDEGHKNIDRTYRVVSSFTYSDSFFETRGTPKPLSSAMRQEFAQQFEKVGAIEQGSGIVKVNDASGKEKMKSVESVYYAEPDFFEIVDFTWLQGNPRQSLTEPNTVVLTDSMAMKLFGDWRTAMGQRVNFDNRNDLRVTGIVKRMPDNSSFPLNIIISYKTFQNDPSSRMDAWGSVSSSSECYVLLKKGVDLKNATAFLPQFIQKYYTDKAPGKEGHRFQPLKDVHFNSELGNFAGSATPKKQLWGLAIIGIFLLLTACINFINLATAQAVSRSKEVGVRKVMGSMRKQLIVQFLTETVTITVIALLIGCVLTEVALPGLQNLFVAKIPFSIFQHPIILVFMIILVLVVSFLAGFYPAMIMSGFSPALAIKNKITANTGGLGLRKVLVVVQFSITIVLIIGTLVILNQMKFMREKSLGFNPSAVAMVYVPTDSVSRLRYDVLQERMQKIPGVQSFSFCSAAPSSSDNNNTSFTFNSTEDANFQVNTKVTDVNYLKTFGLKLVAGRGLTKSDTVKEFVVNETLLKKLNIVHVEDALNKPMTVWGRKGMLVGVVKDFNNLSLHEPISPVVMMTRKTRYNAIAIKLNSKQIHSTMQSVESIWKNTYPDYVYTSNFVDDQIKAYYEMEQVMGVLFKVFAGIIMFIAFIGLFGLISFVATQRTREVAIRKVLGASTFELVKMLNGSFLLMVFIANVVAWPLAYLFVSKWLSGYVYRIEISVWPFVIAMIISMLVTLLTVSFRSYKAAVANAIDALKDE